MALNLNFPELLFENALSYFCDWITINLNENRDEHFCFRKIAIFCCYHKKLSRTYFFTNAFLWITWMWKRIFINLSLTNQHKPFIYTRKWLQIICGRWLLYETSLRNVINAITFREYTILLKCVSKAFRKLIGFLWMICS